MEQTGSSYNIKGLDMKYIKKAKNTQMKGILPDDYLVESVEQNLISVEQLAEGNWELVEDEVACQLLQASMEPVIKPAPILTPEQKLALRAGRR